MSKSRLTRNVAEPVLEKTGNHFDELNHRFSDLLVNSSLLSEDNTDDSEKVFRCIKACKNVTFTRSRSYFEDEIQLFPLTPARVVDKHALLTSDEEDTNMLKDVSQSSVVASYSSNLYSVLRSPLKESTPNSWTTPKPKEKTAKGNVSSILCFSGSKKSNVKNKPNVLTPDYCSRNKENLSATGSILVSPNSSYAGISLSLGGVSCKSPFDTERTPLNSHNKKVSNTPTPFNKALASNMIFKTPISSNKTPKCQYSALKRNSIDKAVASARREFEEMVKNVRLKKSILKAKQKERNDSLMDEKCNSPASSTARSSLFSTPISSNKTNEGPVKTPLQTVKKPNNCSSLKGVKGLKENEERTPYSEKQSSNLISSITKGQTLLSDDDDDDNSLPSTQPLISILLRHVVAYVEVRCGRDYLSEGTKAELESLGARVEKNFTRKVTHCFFHGGRMSTYRKAIEWKVPLVSTLWIEACKAALEMLPLKGYAPHGLEKYREALPLYKLKTKGLRRAVTDSKIRRKPWKEDELNKKATQALSNKPLPPVPTFKETDKIIDALHSVAGDLRKATNQFEKILTSPVLQKKKDEEKNNAVSSETNQATNTSNCRRKRNKKLVFGSSSDDGNKKEDNLTIIETGETSSKISDINDPEIRVSYDSDDLLVYAKKQAANTRCSAPPRLLTSRKCKKLLSSCKDPQKKNNGEITSGPNVREDEQVNRDRANSRPTRRSKNQPKEVGRINEKEKSSEKPPQAKKRKLLLPLQVIANFEQDSGESTPPASPRCPYKATPNKKPKTGLATKSKTVTTLASVRVMSDCDSDDSLTRAARRESSALFVKKDKKTIPQKIIPTIVCTSLSRSDEDAVKAIVAQLGTFVVEAAVSERTTHVVTPMPRRTINLLKGIARGCWVLNVQWVYTSLEVGQWLPEERFELTAFSPAVKMARCDRQAFGPEFSLELFTGLGPFYVCRATVPPARDLAELLRLGGGAVVSNARAAKIVIGSTPPLSPCGRAPPLMVREKWVLDCITRLTQLSTNDYITVVDSEP